MTEAGSYSALDRALHKVAFASLDMQVALGEVESRLFARRLDPGLSRRAVFVTSLPRAGTTVLLNLLAGLPEFASATYRQMPFTLCPLLWDRISREFRRNGTATQRAHGDGVEVDFDSPEAFEEVLWMAFWPEHYGPESIRPWRPEAERESFETFMRRHMAKIVAGKPGARRYLSKNNANIARLGLLERLFPDAVKLVPFRHPWAQAASLRRQHLRFRDIHRREPFARRYMENLGHFEFGEALRPIGFGEADRDLSEVEDAAFWLAYWCDAYAAALDAAGERTVFVDHGALCADPEGQLRAIASAAGISDADLLCARAGGLRPQRPAPPPDAPEPLLRRAAELHSRLRAAAIGPEDARRGAPQGASRAAS